MTDRYTQYIKISSTDGKNTMEKTKCVGLCVYNMGYECPVCSDELETQGGVKHHVRYNHPDYKFPHENAELLERLYWDHGYSLDEIADHFEVSKTAIYHQFKEHEIPTRDRSGYIEHQPYMDAEVLERLYHGEGLTLPEMAERLNCGEGTVHRWMVENNIERRDVGATKYPEGNYFTIKRGYVWFDGGDYSTTVEMHRLLAIAEGADPYKIFGGDYHVHHRNNIQWDNRPENLELLTPSEHTKKTQAVVHGDAEYEVV